MKLLILILVLSVGIGVLLQPAVAAPTFGGILTNPLGPGCGFACLVGKVADFLLKVAVPLAAIMVLVGGFQMITAAGNPEQFSKGKKTLLYAAIGLVVVLAANGIESLIRDVLR